MPNIGDKYLLNPDKYKTWYIRSCGKYIQYNEEIYWPITVISIEDFEVRYQHPTGDISFSNLSQVDEYLILQNNITKPKSRLDLIFSNE